MNEEIKSGIGEILTVEPTVTVKLTDYQRLIRESERYVVLKEAVVRSMRRSSYGSGVDLDNSIISAFRAVCPDDYDEILASWENTDADD